MSYLKYKGQNMFWAKGRTTLFCLGLLVFTLSCGSDDRKTDPTIITPLGQRIGVEGGEARNPRLAMDPATGDAIAVWEQWDGKWFNIWVNRYAADTGWGQPELIENIETGNARNPRVVMDPAGNAIAIWAQFDGLRFNIRANMFVSGVGWDVGAAEFIEANDTGSAVNPQVTMDSLGNALVVWEQFDGTRYNIWGNWFVSGAGWDVDAAELIEANDTGSAVEARVAMGSSGNAIVVWQHFDGSRYNIWANGFTPLGGWAGPLLIENQDLGRAVFPQVAMDPSTGDALAVWQQYDGDRYNIWSNRFVSGAGWEGAQLIEIDDVGSDARPQIAMDPSGDALAVWQQYDGTRYNVWANRFTSGVGWGGAERIEENNSGDAAEPGVAMNASGNAIAVWQLWDGGRYNLWAREYTPGIGWGSVELVENDNAGDAWSPQVAVDDNGNTLIVWFQNVDGRYNIYGRRIR